MRQKAVHILNFLLCLSHAGCSLFQTYADLTSLTDPTDMYEHLQERFGRGNRIQQPRDSQSTNTKPKLTLDLSIREYEKAIQDAANLPSWCQQREIPTPQEIRGDLGCNGEDDEVEVPVNEVSKPWPSKEEYLEAHYGLLREEAVAPLRNVVSELLAEPQIEEKHSQENAAIYEKVPRSVFL